MQKKRMQNKRMEIKHAFNVKIALDLNSLSASVSLI